jgi:hypothetical protein
VVEVDENSDTAHRYASERGNEDRSGAVIVSSVEKYENKYDIAVSPTLLQIVP